VMAGLVNLGHKIVICSLGSPVKSQDVSGLMAPEARAVSPNFTPRDLLAPRSGPSEPGRLVSTGVGGRW
jgi:hypothetical protein